MIIILCHKSLYQNKNTKKQHYTISMSEVPKHSSVFQEANFIVDKVKHENGKLDPLHLQMKTKRWSDVVTELHMLLFF